ncbi:MAG: hypothetical protein Q8K63_02055 [Acidimicrobiales bacterium]|nr:hypothetical protein [Acidimicrobiales bacterium]
MRVYRALLLLYPKSFRLAHGEDMVAVFEEMRRDRSPVALWWRVLIDAFTSSVTQRLESLMSKNSMLRPAALAAVAFTLLVAFTATGIDNVAVFLGSVLLTGGCTVAALVYWQANRKYVEPTDELHHHWLRVLATGAALIAVVNVGSGLGVDVWWLAFVTFILGVMLLAVGVILGVWHAIARVRPASV